MSYLVIAYLVILSAIFGYVLYLTARTNRLLQEIESLKARIGRSSTDANTSGSAHQS